jgi:AcrR family transcriptional regulator
MKTRDKIVYAALKLFNEQGERAITTNHIATALNISPGNLYYHFSNKQEIVREIFTLYSSELLARFKPLDGQQESLLLLKHYLDSIFSLMWKYRFLYANLLDILQSDKALHADYIQTQKQLQHNLLLIMRNFVAMKLISIDDSEVASFITTLHLIASGWLSYQASVAPISGVTQSLIYDGMLQMISVFKPRATVQGVEQLKLLEEGIRAVKQHINLNG